MVVSLQDFVSSSLFSSTKRCTEKASTTVPDPTGTGDPGPSMASRNPKDPNQLAQCHPHAEKTHDQPD